MATKDPSLTNPLLTFTMTNGALQLCDNVTADTDYATHPGFYFNCPDGMEFTWPAQLTVTNKEASSIYIIVKTESSDGRPYYKYKRPSGGAPSIPNTDDGSQWTFDSDFIASLCEAASAATPAHPATPTTGLRGAYVGVGGLAKPIAKIYVGVGGVAKEVKLAYVGVPVEDPPAKIVNNTPALLTIQSSDVVLKSIQIPAGSSVQLDPLLIGSQIAIFADHPALTMSEMPEGWGTSNNYTPAALAAWFEGPVLAGNMVFASNDTLMTVTNSNSSNYYPRRYTDTDTDTVHNGNGNRIWQGNVVTTGSSTKFYVNVGCVVGLEFDDPSGNATWPHDAENCEIGVISGGFGFLLRITGTNPSAET
jgi:hypothetical protein